MKGVKRNKGNSFCADCHKTAKVLTQFKFLFIPFIVIVVDFYFSFFFLIGDASLLFPHWGEKIWFTEFNISSISSPLSSAPKCTAKSIDCRIPRFLLSAFTNKLAQSRVLLDESITAQIFRTLSGSLTQSQTPAIGAYSESDECIPHPHTSILSNAMLILSLTTFNSTTKCSN